MEILAERAGIGPRIEGSAGPLASAPLRLTDRPPTISLRPLRRAHSACVTVRDFGVQPLVESNVQIRTEPIGAIPDQPILVAAWRAARVAALPRSGGS
jgi:hypothetical protein